MNRIGPFDAAAAREALEELRRERAGAIVVTDGARDLRLAVTPDEVSLEAVGHVLQGGEPRDLVRELLCALFWDDPTCLVEGQSRPLVAREDVSAIRVGEQVEDLLRELAQGVGELSALHRRVRGLDALVAVRGGPPPGEPDQPTRLLFEALKPHGERGECLGAVIDQLPLDPLDTAWAVADLLDAEQATVRPSPLPALLRRLRHIEPLEGAGLVPGLRQLHAGRLLARVDRRQAAARYRAAADELLGSARPAAGVEALREGLQHDPDDLPGRELLVTCLERDLRHAEARPLREELLELYSRCGLPARARAHLEALDQGAPAHKLRLMGLALEMRDFSGAEELAVRWHSAIPADRLAELPFEFARAGAPAPHVAAVATLAGFDRRRRRRLLVWGLAALLLLGAAVATAEVQARLRFQHASTLARSDLQAGAWERAEGRWAELGSWAGRLRVEAWPAPLRARTCLARVGGELRGIADLQADAQLLRAEEAAQGWRARGDTRAARAALEQLLERARSAALRQEVEGALRELDDYRRAVREEVERLGELVTGSRLDQALRLARTIRAQRGDARDLWAGASMPLRVVLRPLEGARLYVDGQAVPPVDRTRGEWEVSVPIDGERGPLIRAEADHALPRQMRLLLSDRLVEPAVWLRMFTTARLGRGDPPERGSAPGLFVYEDEPELAAAAQASGVEGPLVRPDLVDELAALLPPLLGTGLRLSVVLRSEARQRRLTLLGLEVYLQDLQRGRAAEPRRIDLGRVTRPLQRDEQGTWRLAGLSCVDDDLAYLGEALRETVRSMAAELEAR